MTGRPVLPVPVVGADGGPLLAPLRAALSGAGPAVAPHAAGREPSAQAVAPLREDEDGAEDPVAAVVSTTGSTGRAKHVLLDASALLAGAAATHDVLGGAGSWLLAVPAHTVAGVQVVVRSLVAGTRPAVLDLAGGFDPAAFAREASALAGRARGRRYTSLVPAQLDLLLEAGTAQPEVLEALRGFDAVLVGGAALPPAVR
ncbi:AMP-binding protein, partial [Aquipuribacter hungaricus]